MPRRPRSSQTTDETRWQDASCISFEDSSCISIQVAGFNSSTRTYFVRLLLLSPNTDSILSVRQVVERVLQEQALTDATDCDTLWQLGAIWILDTSMIDRPQNFAKWYRWKSNNQPCTKHMILRIHSRPPRFAPKVLDWNISRAIIYNHDDHDHDATIGFVIVNKPDGIPSHGTVDNAVENLLSYFQSYQQSKASESKDQIFASLPHRLDIETSGLLLICTNKTFMTYASKLFQQKKIQKYYRCLLSCPSVLHWKHLMELHKSQTIVTHFLDANSSAPKRFAEQPPPSGNDTWLECQLLLRSVAPLKIWNDTRVVEVEIQLLTGRTHQIRGQMATLGCPIVGDPLYGPTYASVTDHLFPRSRGCTHTAQSNSCSTRRMALQCFRLVFEIPSTFIGNERVVDFELDQAWWSDELSLVMEEEN